MKTYITIGVCIGIVAAVCLVIYMLPKKYTTMSPVHPTVSIGATHVQVDVVRTPESRQRGLSGRDSLAWGTGMLFVFDEEDFWSFWMKDMNFPIDIIWINKEGIVVTVVPDVSPATYPSSFKPSAPALYVLEVPAGYAAAERIGVGQKVVVQY